MFRRKLAFLGNFFDAPIKDKEGKIWPTSEHMYQACKASTPEEREVFRKHPKKGLKALARHTYKTNWDKLKYDYMYRVVKSKFRQHPELLCRLKATPDNMLVEYNYWHDNYWGDCQCGKDSCIAQGLNKLGEILKKVKYEL